MTNTSLPAGEGFAKSETSMVPINAFYICQSPIAGGLIKCQGLISPSQGYLWVIPDTDINRTVFNSCGDSVMRPHQAAYPKLPGECA
jgi:hypothetical protein